MFIFARKSVTWIYTRHVSRKLRIRSALEISCTHPTLTVELDIEGFCDHNIGL